MILKIIKNGEQVNLGDLSQEEKERALRGFLDVILFGSPFNTMNFGQVQEREGVSVGMDKEILTEKESETKESTNIEETCSGNPDDCPICGGNSVTHYSLDFADALKALKEGEKVVRKSWLDGNLDVIHLVMTPAVGNLLPFIAVVDTKGLMEPYIIQNDDLMGEDWMVLGE